MILTVTLLFSFNHLTAQNIVFKLSDGNEIIHNFFIKSFEGESYQLFQSKDSSIQISEKSLDKADSVKLYYSFFEEKFDRLRINSGIYTTKNYLSLKAVTVNSVNKKTYKYEPRGRRGKILNATFNSNLIDTKIIEGRFIKGIELYFSKLRWSGNLKKFRKYNDIQKNAKFRLYIALTNQSDTIYLKQTKYFTYEFEIDKAGYTYFDLNGFDSNISDFKYLIIGIKPLTPNMILSVKKLKSNVKGIISLNQRMNIIDEDLYFVKGNYLNGELVDDRSIDFKLHYTK